jgi:hypothetical protein
MGRLREKLGPGWELAPLNVARPVGGNDVLDAPSTADMVWTIRSPSPTSPWGELLVEAKDDLSPSEAGTILRAEVDLVRLLRGQVAVLVIAPWLSPRTRAVLDERGFGYLDLTGNVSLRLNQPGVSIRTDGANRDPDPPRQIRRGLRGEQAGRVVRLLVDHAPPYRASDIARVSGTSLGYVSRLLEVLADQALITREGRQVIEVDWQGLLRARAANYELLNTNRHVAAVARKGLAAVYEAMRTSAVPLVVTGPVAAQAVAPLTSGGQLMIYVDPSSTPEAVTRQLGLLATGERSSTKGDVLLLEPPSQGPFERDAELEGVPGVRRVGLSQLVVDCLGGTGRMPAEGEAVLAHMAAHLASWREDQLPI